MGTTGMSSRTIFLAIGVIGLILSGCGSDGKDGATGPQGPAGESAVPPTELHMSITSASVNSAPVVNFTVTDQDGKGYAALADTDLRFNIAKLTSGNLGSESTWQNYIVRASGSGEMQGSQERVRTGYPFGTLTNHGDGTYTYTFATDITSPSANPCPSPCTDVDGNPLDISYDSSLTHRIGIQQGNRDLPLVNATFDFVPAGGSPTLERNIVKTETCNQCHRQLRLHGSRIETKLCVTCHNPGSWVSDPANETVDFKIMIHRIHMGADLPVLPYAIGNHDYSTVEFPADVRSAAGKNNANGGTINRVACTKCHDPNDTDTPQAIAYQTPKRAACSSCHNDVDFATGANHPGGIQTDDSGCTTCHKTGTLSPLPGSVMESHTLWDREYAQDCFQYEIVSVTPDPAPPGSTVTVTFKVTNPNPGLALGPDQRPGDPDQCPRSSECDEQWGRNLLGHRDRSCHSHRHRSGGHRRPSRRDRSVNRGAYCTGSGQGRNQGLRDHRRCRRCAAAPGGGHRKLQQLPYLAQPAWQQPHGRAAALRHVPQPERH
jgi:predicted CXXCH cytochrome family protein